ncbi:MAG: hypothetical protein HOK97_03910 [Deltaproteobacteria bacterium]|nr:hypothetical protein [Deltaproteobacteria bacterium]
MSLLVKSTYMSGLLSRHALRGMRDGVSNDDGKIGDIPRELFLNIHPLKGAARLESHQVLGRVLESVFETIHACENKVHHPDDLALSNNDHRLTDAVNESLESNASSEEVDYWAADDDVWVSAEGSYVVDGIPVKPFRIEVGFCPSWQTHNNLFEELEELIEEEPILVPCDEFELETLPSAYRFHIDALGEEDQLEGVEFAKERQAIQLVSVGRVVVERYTMDVAQAVGQALCGDRDWLSDKNRSFIGLRVWAVDAWGHRSLVVLGGAQGGMLYVGQVDV